MSKINLTAKDWCDLVFEGRNKSYGAYRLRANQGRRQRAAVIILLIALAAIIIILALKTVVQNALEKNLGETEQITQLANLEKKQEKKEEKKIEKPKEEPKPQPKVQEVKVQNSIQLVVPKIVDDDKVVKEKELKTQKELTTSTSSIGSITFDKGGAGGINIDDLKKGQAASDRNVGSAPQAVAAPQAVEKKEVMDNNVVDVPASFPGGEAALIRFVSTHTKYPEIDQEQGVQGTVMLRFKVDVDGSISSVTVRKSLSRTCDAAAMAVVRQLPRFTPAKSNGKPVPVWFNLPVKFQLQ